MTIRNLCFLASLALSICLLAACSSGDDPKAKAAFAAYQKYHAHVQALDLEQVKKSVIAGKRAEMEAPGAEQMLMMVREMTPKYPKLVSAEVKNNLATLSLTGEMNENKLGQISGKMTGKVELLFVAENWKIKKEHWSIEIKSTAPEPTALISDPAQPPKAALILRGHDSDVNRLAFTPDGEQLISISYADKTLRVWDADSGIERQKVTLDRRPVDMILSRDGSEIFTVDAYGHIKIWPFEDGKIVLEPTSLGNAGKHAHLAVNDEGTRLVSTSWDTALKIWDLDQEKMIDTIEYEKLRGVAFVPKSNSFIYGDSGNTLTFREPDRFFGLGWTSRKTVPKVDKASDIAGVALSADGELLATAHMDSSLTIWKVNGKDNIHNFYVPDASAYAVAFSPDGSSLASAHQDGRVYLWDPKTAKQLARLSGHKGAVKSLAWHPWGTALASGGEDGIIAIWK